MCVENHEVANRYSVRVYLVDLNSYSVVLECGFQQDIIVL